MASCDLNFQGHYLIYLRFVHGSLELFYDHLFECDSKSFSENILLSNSHDLNFQGYYVIYLRFLSWLTEAILRLPFECDSKRFSKNVVNFQLT